MNNFVRTTVPFILPILITGCLSGESPATEAEPIPNLSGFWTVRFDGQPLDRALIDSLPEDAVLIDDVGSGELGQGEYSGLVLSEQAIQEISKYDFDREWEKENTCDPPSVAFYMQAPFPIEIHQGRDLIVFKIEYYDMFRVVFLDGRGHPPAEAPHSKNGHSIGHWEGGELVVDTTHISSATFMNNGFSHSDNLHLVERFKLSEDGQTLWSTEVSEDPEVFSGKAARHVAWRKVPGEYVFPYECDPSFGR